jgi:hypothetical protein
MASFLEDGSCGRIVFLESSCSLGKRRRRDDDADADERKD